MTPLEVGSQRTVDVFDGVASIACGDILLLLWRTPARRERIGRVAGWIDAVIADNPDTIAVCQFLLSSASPPDRDGRAVARREALRLEAKIRRAVMVPLGDSLWQSVVRGILRVAVLIAGHADQLKVVSSEREALDSLTEIASARSGTRQELETAVEALYGALDIARPGVRR